MKAIQHGEAVSYLAFYAVFLAICIPTAFVSLELCRLAIGLLMAGLIAVKLTKPTSLAKNQEKVMA